MVAELLEDLAYEKKHGGGLSSRQNSLALQRSKSARGTSRLRDAVVYGYLLQRHAQNKETASSPSAAL